jgi:AP-2 complex subunit beta-1
MHAAIMFLPHYLPPSGYEGVGSPFTRSAQGKVAELRLELNSGGKKDKNHAAKKIALKKIVANMTMTNNDMIALFPDIVGCMEIPSLEIKKMCAVSLGSAREVTDRFRCFLFLVNYARMKPEVALKALPTLEAVCIL